MHFGDSIEMSHVLHLKLPETSNVSHCLPRALGIPGHRQSELLLDLHEDFSET